MDTESIPLIEEQTRPRAIPEEPSKIRKQILTKWDMVSLNAFWFGYNFFWFIVTIVIVPSQIESIMGSENKGVGLGTISFFSGVMYLFLSPVAGALNDRFNHELGRRRPWIMLGTLGMCVGLFLMSPKISLFRYTIAYLILNFSAIVCSIPFNGLVADMTSQEQNGIVSSTMGAFNLFGYLIGAFFGVAASSVTLWFLYMVMSAIFITCAYITCRMPEPHVGGSSDHLPPVIWNQMARDILRPLWTHPNFRLVFLSRFLFQLGIATIQSFLQYWIGDCISTTMDPTTAVSIVMIPNLVLSPLTALITPSKNRKVTVYYAALVMSTACIFMMFSTEFPFALVVSALFGSGYGPFMTVEFAMLMDVLPSQHDVARDMSLWHTALVLPQILSTPISGWMLDIFQEIGKGHVWCLGYKVINSFTIVYFIAGAILTKVIQGIQ
jgi:MFS family permease